MEEFTEKLRLLYNKMFHQDMEKFTEAFINYQKFNPNKFDFEAEEESRQQFFSNRKTVLRRWLQNGVNCTPDFRKSFHHYQISKHKFRAKALFTLNDFQIMGNLIEFEQKLDAYLLYLQSAYVNTEYQYLYLFDEKQKNIQSYEIIAWKKGEREEVSITVEHNQVNYYGTFSLQENNNIFISLQIHNTILYMLFHDMNDSSCAYIVGTSMGYLAQDNKVPRAEKVILAKEKLDNDNIEWQLILNETEVVSAIENRMNLQGNHLKFNPLGRYSQKLKKYHTLFSRLILKKFQTNFYHRLAFREFFSLTKLFEKVANKESYFVVNQERAFFELIETLEATQNISFYMVIEYSNENLFFPSSPKALAMKKRFLNLYTFGIQTELIFVVEDVHTIPEALHSLLEEMQEHHISVNLVSKSKIIHSINSIDFFFIYERNQNDFVFADPLRDSKDVYKIFTNHVTMEEYRIDYHKILEASVPVTSYVKATL